MPICKKCHSRIDKFNKDRCPICGVENPFEGVTSDTIEITSTIDTDNLNIDYHPRKKSTLFALFACLGIFGVPFFYIYKKGIGLIYCFSNLVLIAITIILLTFLTPLDTWVSVLLPIIFFVFVNVLVGLYFYNKPNLKDGRGVFIA